MAVTWVGGTTLAKAFESFSITSSAPSGLAASGDTLFAAVMAFSAITTPSGWTKVAETPDFSVTGLDANTYTARVALFSKDSVGSGDAEASFTFEQASETFIAITFAAVRGVDALAYDTVTTGGVNSWEIEPDPLAATLNGSIILAFAGSIVGGNGYGAVTPGVPTDFTLTSGAGQTSYLLAGAYRLVDATQENEGVFNFSPGGSPPSSSGFSLVNNMGAITVLATPVAGGPGDPEAIATAPTMLGSPRLLVQQTAFYAYSSAPSPLSAPALEVFHDFSAAVEGRPLVYVVDLVTPEATVRVPISSWQATLQTEGSNYLQVVIPACEPFLEAINAATLVRVSRRCILADGTAFEYQMASSPLDNVTTARGPNNYTATLSGYSEGAVLVSSPPSATARTLQDVRTIFTSTSGLRVRCAVDWLLRPAQIAFVGTSPFVVAFINYYVSDGDQYMDVGERVEPS